MRVSCLFTVYFHVLLFAACGNAASDPAQDVDTLDVPPPVTHTGRIVDGLIYADTFDVRWELREGRELILSLNTDLPDTTVIDVVVSRTEVDEDGESHAYHYYDTTWEGPLTVGDLRHPLTAFLNDRDIWVGESDVSDEVHVKFTVPDSQPRPFRSRNSNLRGDVVAIRELGRRTIEREFTFELPVDEEVVTPWPDPRNLISGRAYRLSRSTPFLPVRYDGGDPAEVVRRIVRAEPGTEIEILYLHEPPGETWYRVRTRDGVEGWVSAGALVGQRLETVH